MSAETPVPQISETEQVYSRDDLHDLDRTDQGVLNVFEMGVAETGVWPATKSEEQTATTGLSRRLKPRRVPTPRRVVDGDSGLDPNWHVSQGDPLTAEEEKVVRESLESIRAKAEAVERQRLVAAGENPDAVLRARAMKKKKGYLA